VRYAQVAVPVPLHPLGITFDYRIPTELDETIAVGSMVALNFGRRKSWGIVCSISEKAGLADEAKIKNLDALVFPHPVFSTKRMEFIQWLSSYYYFPLGPSFETALPAPVRKASAKLLWKVPADPKLDESLHPEAKKKLNAEQQAALDGILASQAATHLLWGITGSGKTEVYLQLIERALSEGKSALVLVPEIALTPLLRDRFEKRFPGELAIFHSAQKDKEIRENWLSVHYGKKRIALGARSALFAPLENIGFIVIDEEHDSSYKQEERLRYHTREAAAKLAALYGAKLILGSATPSLEAFALVGAKRADLHRLHQRAVERAELPSIEIIDLKKLLPEKSFSSHAPMEEDALFEGPEAPENLFLSPPLDQAISETLAAGKQSILFLNKRGVGSQLFCRLCGHILECPSCHVKLTPHLSKLLCHYCNYQSSVPEKCPSCAGEKSFFKVGIGTQSLEKLLELHFPKARLLRLDRDTVTKAGELERIVGAFSSGEADILIGTQMVAKGHDFPNVTLVGILLADMGLGVPDFRADERTLQLLLQVAGRAGRAGDRGRVLIQCFQEEHPILRRFRDCSVEGPDYEDFLVSELEKRRALNYSPAASMVLLRFDSLTESKLREAASAVAKALVRAQQDKFQVLGPAPAPIYKIRNRFRSHILLKGRDAAAIRRALEWILEMWATKNLEKNYECRLQVDVDPMQMM
jgi:primosomal protein N' (replication factor Y)